jgi:protein required for attachment to host cells/ribosomal protein L30E
MELKELQQHIRLLAALDETEAPVVSCYLDLSDRAYRSELSRRRRELRKLLAAEDLNHFEESMQSVESYLGDGLEAATKGVAVFARSGSKPLFLPLEFSVPVPTRISVDTLPSIYQLVALKDTYHRYIVLLSSEEKAQIVEVNLGTVTRQVWVERPDLRPRVGREWSKNHYQNHRRERTQQFVREKIKLLERLVSDHGYSHLILAGPPQITARVRKALPKSLADKLVDVVSASSRDRVEDVVAETLSSFVGQEEQESLALADELLRAVRTGGLAVTGSEEVLTALRKAQVDVLVVSAAYEEADREEMVWLAERSGCQVEVVNTSEALDRLGGVGALLRYRDY